MILEFDEFIRSVEISKNDSFALFLGAGASIISGIPSANDCIWEWKRSIYLTKGPANLSDKLDFKSDQVKRLIQNWLDNEGIYPPVNDPTEYSFYVKQCYPISDDVRKYFQKICERKEPSAGYKLINLLHEAGIVSSVWTTNFDDLCRDASIMTGNTLIDVSLDTVDRIFRPINNKELLLVKLHGDYKYGELKNSQEELSNQDPTFRKKLVEYLNDKHLIVSGYSGRDSSIMMALEESYSQKGSGRLYWCGHGRTVPKPVEELIEKAKSNGRSAFYVPTDGFDKLILSLSKISSRSDAKLKAKYDRFLEYETEQTILPFTLDISHVNSIVKSNLFPLQLPKEVFQFEIKFSTEEKPWKYVKELIKDYEIAAVPFKNYVWALGTMSDINKCFSEKITGKVSRVPLETKDVLHVAAFHQLMVSGLTKLLAKKINVCTNGKDLIWFTKHETARMLSNIMYHTHKAVRISIESDNERLYVSLMPDFQITSSPAEQIITKEIRQEVGRLYFDKLRNKEFNDYINEWRKLFFTIDEKYLSLGGCKMNCVS